MGGSRGGLLATCLVVMATMLLCGMWHGAGWTFIAWGALHGAAICANRIWMAAGIKLPRILGWLLTMLFVVICWVLFRAETFPIAADMLTSMFTLNSNAAGIFDSENLISVAVGITFALIGPTNVDFSRKTFIGQPIIAVASAFVLTIVCLRIGQGRGLEFIYFQF